MGALTEPRLPERAVPGAGPRPSRRDFLRLGAASAGGLLLGVRFSPRALGATGEFRPNAWVRIDPAGKVFLTVGKSEMGQGVRTSLPMILADELGVDLSEVSLEQASPGPDFPQLQTSGSRSLQTMWLPLRTAGAAAREMLVGAAAARWGVAPSECRAENGSVTHAATGRTAAFGALAGDAAKQPVPASPALKPPSALRLIGRDTRRLDAPQIVSGQAVFASDVRLPGMKIACVVRCPVLGGSPREWKESAALAIPGVRGVARVPAGLAVVADDSWAALRGREALEPTIVWDEGPNAKVGSEEVLARLTDAVKRPGGVLRRGGDVSGAIASAVRKVEAEYFYPYQSHAPMEPMSAVADVRSGRCEIWAGTQGPNTAQEQAAKALGIPASAVTVHVTLLGGGFGRRGRPDFVLDAVECSRAAKAPVKVLWTRQDDMRHGYYHPISLHRLEAGLDASGMPAAWRHRVAAASWRSRDEAVTEAQLRGELRGAYDVPYAIPAVEADSVEIASPVNVGPWRGVQLNHNVFASECFFDEVAAAAGRDPMEYRLALLAREAAVPAGREGAPLDRARLRRTLALASEKSGWARPLPPGRGKGVACVSYDGRTPAAVVADVSVDPAGAWTVHRVVCAVDCGVAVNPIGVRAQAEGSVAWALSTLGSQITLKAGRVEQSTYRDFPILRFRDMPKVETHIVPSEAAPSGMGEPPVPVALAAVVNALSAAAGRRIRRLPVLPADRKGA